VTPEQEEQALRALRAVAQADEPLQMPPEVVSRLDDVLADLSGGGAKEHVGIGEDTAAARHRRHWPNVIAAAAVVAVIAAGGLAVATHGFGILGGGGDSTSAESAAPSTTDGASSSAAPSTGGLRGLANGAAGRAVVPSLHRSTLADDVRRLLKHPPGFGATRAPRTQNDLPGACARPFTGAGSALYAVRLDGQPATLVVGPPRNGQRPARVYSCAGAGSPLASVSVRAR
jgi:hypothetical protein